MSAIDSKLLSQLAPRDYDGKEAQAGLRFTAMAKLYHTQLVASSITANLTWIMVLNKLTDDAARWAGPHIIDLADGKVIWSNVDAFETAFRAHFCAVDDKKAALSKLVKLCKALHKLGTAKDYTVNFNAIAARTPLSDEDKRARYVDGLPYKIQNEFAVTAHEVDTLEKAQKVALRMDQQLAERAKAMPKTKGWGRRGERVAADRHGPEERSCFNCGEKGHIQRNCKNPLRGQQAAASTATPPNPTPSSNPSTSDELVALRSQLKELSDRIAAVSLAKEKEGF
ncbi:hypothetical protein DICSQDRAFT_168824 [Dichomitus squalens LYAD-421 SS1]|uniref:uncharacterized protein n=1 Tax=Dichomitus squalens (strain LYAD-421) TaxID=732165 RepID=UPI0004412961|nr:uncharacterized protein DICSQDRAFT_168824 [Dichomitus squalens LYAD-421 SS1]EJF63150.1 hypothetical protein DICSQDRAFT_168824 [Dichomitus squalens LYAD-421 SS1]